MVRKYKNEHNDICIDVDCTDKCSMLRFVRMTEDSPHLYEVSLWQYAGTHNSFLTRFKAAWKMLQTGYSYDNIILSSENLKELKEIL